MLLSHKRSVGAWLLFIASALVVAGCGGSNPPNEQLSGSISGLTQSGLVVEFNGMSFPAVAGATSLQFGLVTAGNSYAVTVTAQPTQETCTVTNGNGTMPTAAVTVPIDCVLNTYYIGGSITGLTDPGLVLLNNGGDSTAVKPNAAAFTMNTAVTSGGAYAITIKSQPYGETCTLGSPSGADVLAAVTTVTVQCAPWSSATVSTLYSFTGSTDGTAPAVLFQGADSNL